MKKLILLLFIPLVSFSQNEDILLNGSVSVENNQVKNVADPTDDQDAVTLVFLMNKLSELQAQIDSLQSSQNITDQDGNTYNYLTYGDQLWTVEDAEMITYRDGTPIPQVTDANEWANLTTGAWCYYDNDPTNGKLYNWYAITGKHDDDPNTPNKELAPEGWHVPSDAECFALQTYIIESGYNYDGTTEGNKIAKALASKSGWDVSAIVGSPGNNQNLNNSSNFNLIPRGSRHHNGYFQNQGKGGSFWTSSDAGDGNSWKRVVAWDNESFIRGSSTIRGYGFSVRFIKDVVNVINEQEEFTTLNIYLDGALTMSYQDVDGSGPNFPVITTYSLSPFTTYNVNLEFLNELEEPAENITYEINEENLDYQIFVSVNNGLDVSVNNFNLDENGNILGTQFQLTTGSVSEGTITITLVHEPMKPNDGLESAGGEIDFQATFDVSIDG